LAKFEEELVMGKKKHDLCDLMWKQIDLERFRLDDLISKFYPDGALVEFAEVPQVVKTLLDSPELMKFSKETGSKTQCKNIAEDVEFLDTLCIDFDLSRKLIHFQNALDWDFKACIVMKTSPDAAPISMFVDWELWEGIMMRFLVDCSRKEAFIVLGDDAKQESDSIYDKMRELSDYNSFVKLWEFHALVVRCSSNADDPEYFMISFSKEDERYLIEKIYSSNVLRTYPLLKQGAYREDTTPSTTSKDDETVVANDVHKSNTKG
jgi:hypothetical protein